MLKPKLNSDGNFNYWPGSTIICPIRAQIEGIKSANSESQSLWSNTLSTALHLIKQSPVSQNFACLPAESLHMTVTGLVAEYTTTRPLDMQDSAPEEVEAELIMRTTPFFTVEHFGALLFAPMKFESLTMSSIIAVMLHTDDKKVLEDLKGWRDNVLKAANMSKQSHMDQHITLAYRIKYPTPEAIDQEKQLFQQLETLFKTVPWQIPALVLNPPTLCFYPDMTEFPTTPLYRINDPLKVLLDNCYGAIKTTARFKLPLPKSKVEKRSCVIAILGRALVNGKPCKTLEHRMCKGVQEYWKVQHGKEYERVCLMLSGGRTCVGSDLSEAEAMQEWITSHFDGIDPRNIILEDMSMTTVENALFLRRKLIFEIPEFSNALVKIVTTQSHLARSAFLLNNLISTTETELSFEFIGCKDGDPNDAAVELKNLSSNMAARMAGSLASSSSFRYHWLPEMAKRGRVQDILKWAAGNPHLNVDSVKDRFNATALHTACLHQRVGSVKALLRLGADPNVYNGRGENALHIAVQKRSIEIVWLLLNNKVESSTKNNSINNTNSKSDTSDNNNNNKAESNTKNDVLNKIDISFKTESHHLYASSTPLELLYKLGVRELEVENAAITLALNMFSPLKKSGTKPKKKTKNFLWVLSCPSDASLFTRKDDLDTLNRLKTVICKYGLRILNSAGFQLIAGDPHQLLVKSFFGPEPHSISSSAQTEPLFDIIPASNKLESQIKEFISKHPNSSVLVVCEPSIARTILKSTIADASVKDTTVGFFCVPQ